MKHSVFFVLSLALVLIMSGCSKEPSGASQPSGYLELVQAYDAGCKFLSAERNASGVTISFSDGKNISVKDEDFMIYDCTESSPSEVVVSSDGKWIVGGVDTGISLDTGISCSEAYPVYAYYDEVTLHIYVSNGEVLDFPSANDDEAKNQTLPVIKLTAEGPIVSKEDYVNGSIYIEDAMMLYGQEKFGPVSMRIRGRGNTTWDMPKKPWKVKLDEKASLLGMPADKEWALLANYSDKSLLRNIVALKLSEICGFAWTPRLRSVEVYLNDEYQGVYTLCEHKKVSSDRVNIDVIAEDAVEGEALTGGYYLEIDGSMDETTCFLSRMGIPVMFSDPEEPAEAQLNYIKNLIAELEDVLESENFADPVNGYQKYIDLKSFIDFYIVQELVKNIDGNLRKSTFITKEVGKKMEMYHLWDFDIALGNCNYFSSTFPGTDNTYKGFFVKDYSGSGKDTGWFHYMFKDPEFVKKVQERWNELKPEFDKIPDFIDEQAFYLDQAQKRNFEKWDILNTMVWPNVEVFGSYEGEVDYLKHFYTKRLEWLDEAINAL